MKKTFSLLAFLGIFTLLVPQLAVARPVTLPSPASSIAEEIVSLGSAIDPQSGKLVDGIKIIKYRTDIRGNAKPPQAGGGTTCYSYLANGARWKAAEPWIMNPSNASSLNSSTVFQLQSDGVAKWEDAADGVVGSGAGFNIMGNGTQTNATLSAESTSPDGNNEVYFAPIPQNGVIAVTTVWGIFRGPASGRELVEWDQVFDDQDFTWSTTGAPGTMDFDNIAVHEIGHAVGMGHPSNTCVQETMYAYADFGETIKRDLNTGDITGINALY